MADDVVQRLNAALSDRYAIERELGAGGMATVYLATDLKHDRKVALKVLRPELAAALGAERFLREIKIAANLNHPHILPLHDSGEADGFLFYVMPYAKGESLRDRIGREKQLPVADALKIASEVADALGSAHRNNVIHRDIKPENILLEEGHAVVADFGVARAIEEAGETRLTETGIAIGTPAYLSPEQATGERELDGRSDIYALGCVLYEMLAGQAPFTGPTAESIVHQHIASDAPTVTGLRPTVPEGVASTVTKSLAKAPADRQQTAEELGAELSDAQLSISAPTVVGTRPAPLRLVVGLAAAILVIVSTVIFWPDGSEPTGPPRIAVLPFENLGAAEDEYFADGITEEITSRLAGISGLQVTSRQSASQYKNSDKTPRQIADELGVGFILEGTIRSDRSLDGVNQVRVTPQLIDAATDAHVWTEPLTVALELGEIFRVQAQIAERVAEALDVALMEQERMAIAAVPTENAEAYDAYLIGLEHYNRKMVRNSAEQAIEWFQRAVELDSTFVEAYSKLSKSLVWLWWEHGREPGLLDEARSALDATIAIAPEAVETYLAQGEYLYRCEGNLERALDVYTYAKRLRPSDAEVILAIAAIQRAMGMWNEALENLQKSAELNPRQYMAQFVLGQSSVMTGQFEDAERPLDAAIAIDPVNVYAHRWKIFLHLNRGADIEQARQVLQDAFRIAPMDDKWFDSQGPQRLFPEEYQQRFSGIRLAGSGLDSALYYRTLAETYFAQGETDMLRVYADSLLLVERPRRAFNHLFLAFAYAALDSTDRALEEIDIAMAGDEYRALIRHGYARLNPIYWMATVYTMVGEYDKAIDQLELLVSCPTWHSANVARIDPTWVPLRSHPRFQALLERYGN